MAHVGGNHAERLLCQSAVGAASARLPPAVMRSYSHEFFRVPLPAVLMIPGDCGWTWPSSSIATATARAEEQWQSRPGRQNKTVLSLPRLVSKVKYETSAFKSPRISLSTATLRDRESNATDKYFKLSKALEPSSHCGQSSCLTVNYQISQQ